MLDVLIFDLDGTLVSTLPDIANSVNFAFKKFNLPPKSEKEVGDAVGHGIENLILTCLKGPSGSWELVKEDILKAFRSHYLDHCADTANLYPGVSEILEKYKHQKLTILTNKAEIYTHKILDSLGIAGYFDMVIGGDTTPEKKPETAGILKILSDLRAHPQNCLMIGDSVPDILTAQKVNMLCIGIKGGIGNPEKLAESKPDYLIESFLEVGGILDNLFSIKKTA